MEAYDPAFAPVAFGLNNTGAICYLNSFLQALAGCTSLTRAVLENEEYFSKTDTGYAVLGFIRMYAGRDGRRAEPAPDLALQSSRVLAALMADLARRKPSVRFGGGQESASEALMHILDMMEPAGAPAAPDLLGRSARSPATRLFLHRVRCDTFCGCRKAASNQVDHAVTFNMFHLDALKTPPTTPEEFSEAIRLQISRVDDYKCDACAAKAAAAAAPSAMPAAAPSYRAYRVTMLPEIIVCVFNLYVRFGEVRRARYIPDHLVFPTVDGRGALRYQFVAQIEHSGGMSGGHYWARALRSGGQTFLLNDSSASPVAGFAPTPNTYMVFYHSASPSPRQK